MKKLLAIAAFLLASTAAQAQYTFEYGGRTIRIDPDRGTVSIPGVYDNTGRKAKRSQDDRGSATVPQAIAAAGQDRSADRPQTAPAAAPAPAPAEQAAAPATPAASSRPCPPRPNRRPRPRPWRPPIRRPLRLPPQAAAGCRAASGKACAGSHRSPRCRRRTSAGTCPRHRAGRQFAARRLADRGEGRQGPDRAMRRQSLRLFRRQEVEPEWRAGSDQHEARQGQMERPDTRSE